MEKIQNTILQKIDEQMNGESTKYNIAENR